MRIRFTKTVGQHKPGDVVEVGRKTGQVLIDGEFAVEVADPPKLRPAKKRRASHVDADDRTAR